MNTRHSALERQSRGNRRGNGAGSHVSVPTARRAGAYAIVLAGALACGDEADPIANLPEDAQYIVHMSVDAPDGRVNYFVPVSSLEEGAVVEPSRGLEVPGTARLYAPPSGGFFSVGSTSDLTIARYDLATDGSLSRTGSFSLQNQGINNLSRTMAFVGERKAYYLDERNARIIAWDPEQLEITGEIDLSVAARPGMDLKFVRQNYPSRPGRLITTVTWAAPERETLARETGLLVIDTTRDEIINYEVDTRCSGASEIVSMPNGDIYFATGPDEVVGNAEIRGSVERPACVLRIKAGEERFDPDYLLMLSELVDGRVACNILPSGAADAALFRVLDDTRAEWTVANDQVGSAEAWEWWRVNLETGSAEPDAALGVETVYTNYSLVREQVLVTRQTEGAAESQFFEVLSEGGMRPSLLAPGFLWAATKVR